jgi:hypothetical protein
VDTPETGDDESNIVPLSGSTNGYLTNAAISIAHRMFPIIDLEERSPTPFINNHGSMNDYDIKAEVYMMQIELVLDSQDLDFL